MGAKVHNCVCVCLQRIAETEKNGQLKPDGVNTRLLAIKAGDGDKLLTFLCSQR